MFNHFSSQTYHDLWRLEHDLAAARAERLARLGPLPSRPSRLKQHARALLAWLRHATPFGRRTRAPQRAPVLCAVRLPRRCPECTARLSASRRRALRRGHCTPYFRHPHTERGRR